MKHLVHQKSNTTTLINFRYVAIVKPMSYSGLVTRQRALGGVCVAWVAAFVISLPPLFGMGRWVDKVASLMLVNSFL